MTDVYRGECLLLGWGESHRDGRYVRLQLDEEGKANPFKGLKTGPNGQRFAVVIRMLNDDQTEGVAQRIEHGDSTSTVAGSTPAAPTKPKGKWSDLKPTKRAGILCAKDEFQRFLRFYSPDYSTDVDEFEYTDEDAAAKFVRDWCGVGSRNDINENSAAAHRWERLETLFNEWTGTNRAAQQFESHGANRG